MKKKAFTLIEVLMAVIFLSLAVAALLGTNAVLNQSNAAALELSTAEFLTEQLRELTTLLPAKDPQTGTATFGPEEGSYLSYDDIDDFKSDSFCPPINADRQTLNPLSHYRQAVTVNKVSPSNFALDVADTDSSPFLKVTVKIYFNSHLVCSTSWIRARY
jgi:type II secretory pathway pseudopilin PulG